MDCWSLEVTFGEILVPLGRLWRCLVPGGVHGADLVETLLSIGSLLASFWDHFWSKTVMFSRRFFRCVFLMFVLWYLNGFGTTFERYLDNFLFFF